MTDAHDATPPGRARLARRSAESRRVDAPGRGTAGRLGVSLYLFAVFTAYYVIRPIRDEAGVAGGVANLSWLFTGTLLAMMAVNPPFAALVAKLPRVRFIAVTYRFFMLNLIVFLLLFRMVTGDANVWVGRAFFIWTSVFNLFVVSVFWSFMADLFTSEQGKRLFGFIAAAATRGRHRRRERHGHHGAVAGRPDAVAGGCGPARARRVRVADALAPSRQDWRLPFARASPARRRCPGSTQDAIGGGVLAGLTHALGSPYLLDICLYMLLYTILSTFLYFQQAAIVDASFADRARAHGVLRARRPAGERPDDWRAALPHRPRHEAARRARRRSPSFRR